MTWLELSRFTHTVFQLMAYGINAELALLHRVDPLGSEILRVNCSRHAGMQRENALQVASVCMWRSSVTACVPLSMPLMGVHRNAG